MTRTSRMLLAAAFLATLLAGFALARVFDGRGEDADPLDGGHTDAPRDGRAEVPHGHDEAAAHDPDAEPAAAGDDPAHDDDAGEEGVVPLTPAQIAASGIVIVAVERGGGAALRLAGRVEPTVDARAAVAASIAGRVERVLVAPGDTVDAGTPLAILVSGEAATLRAAADAAVAEAEAARLVLRRDQALVDQGVVARQELEASRARSLAADAMARAAQARSAAAGVADAAGRLTVASPLAGVVGTVPLQAGAFVAAGEVVAHVVDPARTELVFTAPPATAAQVAVGTRLEVAVANGVVAAEVSGVVADVREQGSVGLVRARPLHGTLPPAGSAIAAAVSVHADATGLHVPADAVQTVDGRSVVFVERDGGFRATPVRVGRHAGRSIEILAGLDGDERIAGANAFLLKAELARGEAGHDH